MKPYKIFLSCFIVLFCLNTCTQSQSALTPYLQLLEEALTFGQSEFDKVWPEYNLGDFPIGLYNEKEAFLFNHPSPGGIFQKTDQKIGNYVLYHSDEKPDEFLANTSIDYNGRRTSIFMVGKDMTEEKFYNLLFHEVFHSFQKTQEKFDKRYGNVMLQPFFPLSDLEFYALSYMEQMILKDAYLSDNERNTREKLQQYYVVSDKRKSMLDKKFREYEWNVQINEGTATYAGNKGLELMGFPEESKQNLFELINDKIDTPTGFRRRCYSVGRIFAELLDRFSPDWKNKLQPGFTLPCVLRSVVKPLYEVKLGDVLQEYQYEKIKEEFKVLLEQQAEERKKQKQEILKPGYVEIEFPDQNFLDMSSTRFDPMNISLIEKQLLCHKSILILEKKDRFYFRLNWKPVLTEIAPGNLFLISKIYFTIPEDAQMTLDGKSVNKLPEKSEVNELILKSDSIHMEAYEGKIRKENSHYIVELK
ncbi:hypothetical protein KGY73_07865 [bacterium]|nr:hypothetical protein [bacterium]